MADTIAGEEPMTGYASQAAQDLAKVQESGGFFTDWVFNMFAGAIDIQEHSPALTSAYIGMLIVLVILRLYVGNPIKVLGCALIYIYTTIQTYSLFSTSPFVLNYTPAGWLVTAKAIWFAALFTAIWLWGVSRVLQYLVVTLATTGLGQMLAPLNPLKFLNKFRKSDAELDGMDEGSAKDPKRQLTAIMFTDIVGYSKAMGANEAAMVKKLNIHNEIMRNQIVRNRGTVIKSIGDVFGEGVNIAARIEPKADRDGICVSDVVANAVRNKVPAHFMSIGRLPMKNIANPPELFKVFALEESASQKVAKPGAAAAAPAGGCSGRRRSRRHVQNLRMQDIRMNAALRALAVLLALAVGHAEAADKIILGTDWRAEPEHGGYYQALATGLYAQAGLDVTIRQGGPQVNHAQLLAAGKIDIAVAPNSFIPLNFVAQKVPVVAVAAMFQKDPAVLIAHAGQGSDSLAALKGKKIMISPDTRIGFWRFLKSKYGFTDDQIAPYTFNLAPFLADPKAIQQGYVTSEPFQIARAGKKPSVMLLSDAGYTSYASLVVVPKKLVETRPDLVRKFVDATIKGWVSYLNGDPAPAHALIKKDNPDMSDETLAYGRGKLKEYGIVESGDATTKGIGAMNDERWKAFFDVMAADGLYPKTLDTKQAYTLQFVGPRANRTGVR